MKEVAVLLLNRVFVFYCCRFIITNTGTGHVVPGARYVTNSSHGLSKLCIVSENGTKKYRNTVLIVI